MYTLQFLISVFFCSLERTNMREYEHRELLKQFYEILRTLLPAKITTLQAQFNVEGRRLTPQPWLMNSSENKYHERDKNIAVYIALQTP